MAKKKHTPHKVYLLVELTFAGQVDADEEDSTGRYVREATMDDVLDLSGDFTAELDRDITEAVEQTMYGSAWYEWEVKTSVLGLLKSKTSRKLY